MYKAYGGVIRSGLRMYLVPTVEESTASLLPTLPWRDMAAMGTAIRRLGWAWTVDTTAVQCTVTLPDDTLLVFTETNGTWTLVDPLPEEGMVRQFCGVLARSYWYWAVTLEAHRAQTPLYQTSGPGGRTLLVVMAARSPKFTSFQN